MAEGKRPLGVGFFFSLGHSTIVFALALLLALGLRTLGSQVDHGDSVLHHVTGLIGTSISGAFLYLIAALNIAILVGIARMLAIQRTAGNVAARRLVSQARTAARTADASRACRA